MYDEVNQRYFQRPLIRHYALNTQGLVYVVDSADRERL